MISFLKKNQLIYFDWRLIALQYCGGFCHTSTWISHGCTCVPHPENPFYLPPYSIPLGCPRAPSLTALFALVIYFNMVIYMSLCYFLIPFYAHLIPHSPIVCSLHLCLFCHLAHFLNTSVHVCVYFSSRVIPCFIALLFLLFANAAVFTN